MWESLETFAAIVNAACESDLNGEVTSHQYLADIM